MIPLVNQNKPMKLTNMTLVFSGLKIRTNPSAIANNPRSSAIQKPIFGPLL